MPSNKKSTTTKKAQRTGAGAKKKPASKPVKMDGFSILNKGKENEVVTVSGDRARCVLGRVMNDSQVLSRGSCLTLNLIRRVPELAAAIDSEYDLDEDTPACEMSPFLAYIQECAVTGNKDLLERINKGLLEFEDLPYYFKLNQTVIFDRDPLCAGVITATQMQRNFFREQFVITVRTISNAFGTVNAHFHTVDIASFKGMRPLSELPVKSATPSELEYLRERGKKFLEYARGDFTCMAYEGQLKRRSWWCDTHFRADGRCIVDAATMRQVESDYFSRSEYFQGARNDRKGGNKDIVLTDEELCLCSPYLCGFSLTAKQWGEFEVAHLSPVNYHKDAFRQLALEDDKKVMIKALVEHSKGSFTDIIEGKGGGCIFLLHGPPGTGKTLTAEAVAEVLERPLYSVSVGELGTAPEELESKLREILDVSTRWDAVVLLDEADIFLEKRDEQNILRNAMVGIFLRLLEYHRGVLFLTTNRVKQFDAAFHSRISVALNYPEMTRDIRCRVWDNLLTAADITGVDSGFLAEVDINGRQIKNAIRLAQTLAKSEHRDVTQRDIESTMALARQFTQDIRS